MSAKQCDPANNRHTSECYVSIGECGIGLCFEPLPAAPDLARENIALRERAADLQLVVDWALNVLIKLEPGDSRAVSDEFVSAAAIACDLVNEECREILSAALKLSEEM